MDDFPELGFNIIEIPNIESISSILCYTNTASLSTKSIS
jgi:hypothetical protein